MVRREAIDNVARFQHREPGIGRIVGNACVTCQASHVEDLSDTPRAQPAEGLKHVEVLDRRDLADITFDIRAHVITVLDLATSLWTHVGTCSSTSSFSHD